MPKALFLCTSVGLTAGLSGSFLGGPKPKNLPPLTSCIVSHSLAGNSMWNCQTLVRPKKPLTGCCAASLAGGCLSWAASCGPASEQNTPTAQIARATTTGQNRLLITKPQEDGGEPGFGSGGE